MMINQIVKHSIFLYLMLLLAVMIYMPNAVSGSNINFPCVIVILSVVSYCIVSFTFRIKLKGNPFF